MTKRTTIPFSDSRIFRFSPTIRHYIQMLSWKKLLKTKDREVHKPCGIHVARTESLLFRLLNAVFIPITMKYFLFIVESFCAVVSGVGEPLSIESCAAFAAANSISRLEMVLSSVLRHTYNEWDHNLTKTSHQSIILNSLYIMLRLGNIMEDFLCHPFYTTLLKMGKIKIYKTSFYQDKKCK